MTYTVLLKAILEKANSVKDEFNVDRLCASHVAVAVADFCSTKYTGFSISDMTYHPSRFEEERLRYVFSKEVKVSSYFRKRLSHNTKDGMPEEEFDITYCERIAASRDAQALSADVVFLCALAKLHESYRFAIRSVISDESILNLLQDTDANIYDYVIEKVEGVCSELRNKADEATAIRTWRPAPKFIEPNTLAALFFENIEKSFSGNVLTLKFPGFFGSAALKASIHKVGHVYYVHDNGCAIKHLSKQVKDERKLARVLKKVCHSCWIHNGRLTGTFVQANQFLNYLQQLVFVAHADLYYTKATRPLCYKNKDYVYMDVRNANLLDEAVLLAELKKCISFHYDETQGLYYWLDMQYALSSTRCSFLMETQEDSHIRISDAKKRKNEGHIFEEFYWGNDDIALYSKFVSRITARFGGIFDGRDIYITDKTENFFKAMMRFFNMAVLLSEFGHNISVPKVRHKE